MSGYKENYARGVAFVVAAGLVWSTGGMLVRLIDEAASGTIAFWRAASMGAAVLLALPEALAGTPSSEVPSSEVLAPLRRPPQRARRRPAAEKRPRRRQATTVHVRNSRL